VEAFDPRLPLVLPPDGGGVFLLFDRRGAGARPQWIRGVISQGGILDYFSACISRWGGRCWRRRRVAFAAVGYIPAERGAFARWERGTFGRLPAAICMGGGGPGWDGWFWQGEALAIGRRGILEILERVLRACATRAPLGEFGAHGPMVCCWGGTPGAS